MDEGIITWIGWGALILGAGLGGSGLLGMAWAVVSYFVVPVLVVEKLGPFAALKRSAGVLRCAWGEALGAEFGIGLLVFLLGLVAIVPAIIGFMIGTTLGIGIGIALTVFCFVLLSLISSALNAIVVGALYLYAAEGAVAAQFDERLLSSAATGAEASAPAAAEPPLPGGRDDAVEQGGRRRAIITASVHQPAGAEALQDPTPGVAKAVEHAQQAFAVVARRVDRAAKLVINTRAGEQSHTGADAGGFDRAPGGRGVVFGNILEVHGAVVDQTLIEEAAQHIGTGAVAVELDGVAQVAQPVQEKRQIRMQAGLAAGDHYAAEAAPAAAEMREQLRQRQLTPRPTGHQVRIVAPAAAQVAALGEDHRGQHAGVVDETARHQARDHHAQAAPRAPSTS